MKAGNKVLLDAILTEVQNLDEIGGADSPRDYVEILEAVQSDIQRRLDNARAIIALDEKAEISRN